MRAKSTHFAIDGKPMLVPDEDVGFSYEDLDASDSGRDESGVLHRFPIRYKVGSWTFSYSHLTQQDLLYMESLFPDGAEFYFTYPDRHDPSKSVTCRAYRSGYSVRWRNARTGLWSGYSFAITQC